MGTWHLKPRSVGHKSKPFVRTAPCAKNRDHAARDCDSIVRDLPSDCRCTTCRTKRPCGATACMCCQPYTAGIPQGPGSSTGIITLMHCNVKTSSQCVQFSSTPVFPIVIRIFLRATDVRDNIRNCFCFPQPLHLALLDLWSKRRIEASCGSTPAS